MNIDYDKEKDTLQITIGSTTGELYWYETGPFSAQVDDSNSLRQISIQKASDFIAAALVVGMV